MFTLHSLSRVLKVRTLGSIKVRRYTAMQETTFVTSYLLPRGMILYHNRSTLKGKTDAPLSFKF